MYRFWPLKTELLMFQFRWETCLYLRKIHYMMNASKFDSNRAPEPVGLYPHARQVGELLFLSGVGPRERDTKKIPGVDLNESGEIVSYDIEKQCHSVFNNVKMILEDAGSSLQ
jgi:2-aminomuconate deaminase